MLEGKSTRLWSQFFNLALPQIRAFHMAWLAFFLCFFAWFGIAPLMSVVRDELALTEAQVGWTIVASVAATILARLLVGWLCDRIGPRLTYTALLITGAFPVMGVGLAWNFEYLLIGRLLIGVVGAAFVITQYHTSIMFAPNVVGTANATSAGWGNLGGGVTQVLMPLVFSFFVGIIGLSATAGWRAAMIVAGAILLITGLAYFLLTQDAPEGNFKQLRQQGKLNDHGAKGSFTQAAKDKRVWALAVIYGACFGVELTINNVAALYFLDNFEYFQAMDTARAVTLAGLFAGLFGLMNLFARTLGGVFADRFGLKWGLRGRVWWLFLILLAEGLTLMLFSQMPILVLAIPTLILFSLCVQMAEGATYAVVPFISKRALGSVAGIVGAGGNAGAVLAGFLFTGWIPWNAALLVLGLVVATCAVLALFVRFTPEMESEARRDMQTQLANAELVPAN